MNVATSFSNGILVAYYCLFKVPFSSSLFGPFSSVFSQFCKGEKLWEEGEGGGAQGKGASEGRGDVAVGRIHTYHEK